MDIKAYSGNYPYIFVSYAHKDKDIVYPFIEELQKRFNVWFDDGIHLGKDYKKEIMMHVASCSLFLFMVSKFSLESDFCKKEIYFAENKKIRFINILIDDNELPDWFLFDYGHIQAFPLYGYPSLDKAIDDMERKSSDWFSNCHKAEEKQEKPIEVIWKSNEVFIDKHDGILTKVSGSVEEFIVPNDVYAIGHDCFKDLDDLKRVIIHPAVIRIEENAFRGCNKNAEICFRANTFPYDCNFYFNPEGLKVRYSYLDDYYEKASHNHKDYKINKDTFIGADDYDEILIIPNGVRKIAPNAFFRKKNLKIVIIPESIKTIEKQTFFDSEVEFIYVLGAKEIKKDAFWSAGNLIGIDLPKNLETISKSAFSQCKSLIGIDLPIGIKRIEKDAFFGCKKLKEIFLHDEISTITGSPFCSCDNLHILCERDRKPIGWSVFWNFFSSPVTWGYKCQSKLMNLHIKEEDN